MLTLTRLLLLFDAMKVSGSNLCTVAPLTLLAVGVVAVAVTAVAVVDGLSLLERREPVGPVRGGGVRSF